MQMNSSVKTHRKTTNPFQNGAGIKKWGRKDQRIGTINFECHAGSFHFFSSSSSMKCWFDCLFWAPCAYTRLCILYLSDDVLSFILKNSWIVLIYIFLLGWGHHDRKIPNSWKKEGVIEELPRERKVDRAFPISILSYINTHSWRLGVEKEKHLL